MKRVSYELMDVDTANVVGFFETRDEAFATVLKSYARFGLTGVEDLGPSVERENGEGKLIGIGLELIELAQTTSPTRLAG